MKVIKGFMMLCHPGGAMASFVTIEPDLMKLNNAYWSGI